MSAVDEGSVSLTEIEAVKTFTSWLFLTKLRKQSLLEVHQHVILTKYGCDYLIFIDGARYCQL